MPAKALVVTEQHRLMAEYKQPAPDFRQSRVLYVLSQYPFQVAGINGFGQKVIHTRLDAAAANIFQSVRS